MRKDAIFINCARGEVVDQNALISALKSGEILGAGLDVTTPEPLPTDHELLSLPNCMVLPHIGSGSFATRDRMALRASQTISDVFEGVESEYLAC